MSSNLINPSCTDCSAVAELKIHGKPYCQSCAPFWETEVPKSGQAVLITEGTWRCVFCGCPAVHEVKGDTACAACSPKK